MGRDPASAASASEASSRKAGESLHTRHSARAYPPLAPSQEDRIKQAASSGKPEPWIADASTGLQRSKSAHFAMNSPRPVVSGGLVRAVLLAIIKRIATGRELWFEKPRNLFNPTALDRNK